MLDTWAWPGPDMRLAAYGGSGTDKTHTDKTHKHGTNFLQTSNQKWGLTPIMHARYLPFFQSLLINIVH